MGVNLGHQMDFSGNFQMDPGWVVCKDLHMGPSWVMWKGFWFEILNGTQLDNLEGLLIGKCDGEVLGRSYGVLVSWSEKGCHLVHQTGTGSGDVCFGCFGGIDGQ